MKQLETLRQSWENIQRLQQSFSHPKKVHLPNKQERQKDLEQMRLLQFEMALKQLLKL